MDLPRNPYARLTAAEVLLVTLVACRASRTTPTPLPFHVALMPIEVEGPRNPGARADEIPTEDEDGLSLVLEEEQLAAFLSAELAGRGFVAVTALIPRGQELVPVGGAERELYWQNRAAEHAADMIARARLSFRPTVESHLNDRFWLNIPLFLLGGPFCYFIEDRTYDARARLLIEFFDASDVHAGLTDDWRVLALPLLAECEGTTLNFLERAGHSVGTYAVSLVVPPSFLATETRTVERRIEEEVLRNLADDLLDEVGAVRREFQRNDIAAFELDEAALRVRRLNDEQVALEVPFLDDGGVGLRAYVLRADGKDILRGDLSGAERIRGRVWIRATIAVSRKASALRLRLEDAAGAARTYTLRITDGHRRG